MSKGDYYYEIDYENLSQKDKNFYDMAYAAGFRDGETRRCILRNEEFDELREYKSKVENFISTYDGNIVLLLEK